MPLQMTGSQWNIQSHRRSQSSSEGVYLQSLAIMTQSCSSKKSSNGRKSNLISGMPSDSTPEALLKSESYNPYKTVQAGEKSTTVVSSRKASV
jgi:hypothetical protein